MKSSERFESAAAIATIALLAGCGNGRVAGFKVPGSTETRTVESKTPEIEDGVKPATGLFDEEVELVLEAKNLEVEGTKIGEVRLVPESADEATVTVPSTRATTSASGKTLTIKLPKLGKANVKYKLEVEVMKNDGSKRTFSPGKYETINRTGPAPVMNSVSPQEASIGDTVTIKGFNFDGTAGNNKTTVDGRDAEVTAVNNVGLSNPNDPNSVKVGTELLVKVPGGVRQGVTVAIEVNIPGRGLSRISNFMVKTSPTTTVTTTTRTIPLTAHVEFSEVNAGTRQASFVLRSTGEKVTNAAALAGSTLKDLTNAIPQGFTALIEGVAGVVSSVPTVRNVLASATRVEIAAVLDLENVAAVSSDRKTASGIANVGTTGKTVVSVPLDVK